MRRLARSLPALVLALLASCGGLAEGKVRIVPESAGTGVQYEGERGRMRFSFEVWHGAEQLEQGALFEAPFASPCTIQIEIDPTFGMLEFQWGGRGGASGEETRPLPKAFPPRGPGVSSRIHLRESRDHDQDEAIPIFGIRRGTTINPIGGFEGPYHGDERVLLVKIALVE